MKFIPRLHRYLLEPVMGKSVTRNELRREVGQRSHLSREAIDVLSRDAKDLGLVKQKGVFGRLEFGNVPETGRGTSGLPCRTGKPVPHQSLTGRE